MKTRKKKQKKVKKLSLDSIRNILNTVHADDDKTDQVKIENSSSSISDGSHDMPRDAPRASQVGTTINNQLSTTTSGKERKLPEAFDGMRTENEQKHSLKKVNLKQISPDPKSVYSSYTTEGFSVTGHGPVAGSFPGGSITIESKQQTGKPTRTEVEQKTKSDSKTCDVQLFEGEEVEDSFTSQLEINEDSIDMYADINTNSLHGLFDTTEADGGFNVQPRSEQIFPLSYKPHSITDTSKSSSKDTKLEQSKPTVHERESLSIDFSNEPAGKRTETLIESSREKTFQYESMVLKCDSLSREDVFVNPEKGHKKQFSSLITSRTHQNTLDVAEKNLFDKDIPTTSEMTSTEELDLEITKPASKTSAREETSLETKPCSSVTDRNLYSISETNSTTTKSSSDVRCQFLFHSIAGRLQSFQKRKERQIPRIENTILKTEIKKVTPFFETSEIKGEISPVKKPFISRERKGGELSTKHKLAKMEKLEKKENKHDEKEKKSCSKSLNQKDIKPHEHTKIGTESKCTAVESGRLIGGDRTCDQNTATSMGDSYDAANTLLLLSTSRPGSPTSNSSDLQEKSGNASKENDLSVTVGDYCKRSKKEVHGVDPNSKEGLGRKTGNSPKLRVEENRTERTLFGSDRLGGGGQDEGQMVSSKVMDADAKHGTTAMELTSKGGEELISVQVNRFEDREIFKENDPSLIDKEESVMDVDQITLPMKSKEEENDNRKEMQMSMQTKNKTSTVCIRDGGASFKDKGETKYQKEKEIKSYRDLNDGKEHKRKTATKDTDMKKKGKRHDRERKEKTDYRKNETDRKRTGNEDKVHHEQRPLRSSHKNISGWKTEEQEIDLRSKLARLRDERVKDADESKDRKIKDTGREKTSRHERGKLFVFVINGFE